MKNNTKRNSVLAAISVAGIVSLAACGSSGGSNATSTPSASSMPSMSTSAAPSSSGSSAAADVTSGASTLRANLTQLLGDHVNLVGNVVTAATAKGLNDPQTTAAVNALSKNTDDLSAAIGSIYGPDAAAQFKQLWTNHIGMFVQYVTGDLTNNQADKQKALSDLANYGTTFSQFLDKASGGKIPAAAAAQLLQQHVATLTAAIDAITSKSADAGPKLYTAQQHMGMTAQALAAGFAGQFPQKFAGDAAGKPATLRAGLTTLLDAHASLASTVVQSAADFGLDSPLTTGYINALSTNTDDLSKAITSVYGADAGAQFKTLWTNHIGNFVDYAKGDLTNNQQLKTQALTALSQYQQNFSKFVSTATKGKLPADAVAQNLGQHVATLTAAFDAIGTKAPDSFTTVYTADQHMETTAQALATGILAGQG